MSSRASPNLHGLMPGQDDPSATASHRTSEYGSKGGPEGLLPDGIVPKQVLAVTAPRRCWRACPSTRPLHASRQCQELYQPGSESTDCGVPKYEIRPAVLVPGRPMAAADTPRRPLPGLCVVTVVTHTAPSPPENGWLSGEPLRKVPSQDRRHGAVVPSSAGCLAGRPL